MVGTYDLASVATIIGLSASGKLIFQDLWCLYTVSYRLCLITGTLLFFFFFLVFHMITAILFIFVSALFQRIASSTGAMMGGPGGLGGGPTSIPGMCEDDLE